MKVSVLGTGMVGRAHAAKLVELGHEVLLGTKDVAKTMAENEPNAMGTPPFSVWHEQHHQVQLVPFDYAALHGEIVWNALNGAISVEVLKSLEMSLDHKILIDIANPLDFSKGMPPSLFVSNTDSLGEQIQRALPNVKVVKTLNTTSAHIQVNPQQLADADHSIFLSGNNSEAKVKVTEILTSYGWKNILDLGDITTARGTEMMLPIWLRLWNTLQTPNFNFKIVVDTKPH